ncbi:DUF4145 domain-containing protein [Pseudomonas sp. WC2401]|uniref:DUF4145 domain-containing protein n=1 Tax=Pseudomonas sp. WC2401 TaxID=3234143 RepID=A0AB39WUT3_9PSED
MKHGNSLPLDRCPHCNVAKPHLKLHYGFENDNDRQTSKRRWGNYQCSICGGVTLAVASAVGHDRSGLAYGDIEQLWPSSQTVHESIPERARLFLEQAIASIHAPAGAVMLTGSSVDAMLKEKGLKEGNLFGRIKLAAEKQLITEEMAAWAHEIRLDANDQRHSDEAAALPNEADAQKAIDFATALAQFLFVLPARVARGRGKPT